MIFPSLRQLYTSPRVASLTKWLARLAEPRSIPSAVRRFRNQRGEYYENLAKKMEAMPNASFVDFIAEDIDRFRGQARGMLSELWYARSQGTHGQVQKPFLSEILAGTVPQEDVSEIAVAEAAGDLKSGLRNLANTIEIMTEIRWSVTEIISSFVVTVLVIHVGALLFAYKEMPTVDEAVSGMLTIDQYGPVSRYAHYSAQWLQVLLIPTMVIEGALIYIVIKSLPTAVGKLRRFLDRMPIALPYYYYRVFTSLRFITGLTGVTKKLGNDQKTLSEGLRLVNQFSQPWLRSHIEQMQANLARMPVNRGAIFDTGLFDNHAMHWIHDLSSYEPVLSKRLEQATDQILKAAPKRFKRTARVLYAAGIVLVIAFTVGSFQLNAKISQEMKYELKVHTVGR